MAADRQTFARVSYHLRILTIREADGKEQTFRTTDEHPFWVDNKGWVSAGALKVGTHLLDANNKPAVVVGTRREEHPRGVAVYNFEVDDFHTYYASQDGQSPPIWVHNSDDDGCGAGRTVIEEHAAADKADDLTGRQKRAYERAIDELAHDIPGQKDHALKGTEGIRSRDLTGSGKGRGSMRILYQRNSDGTVTILNITDTHK